MTYRLLLAFVLLPLPYAAAAQDAPWELVWSDEFDYEGLPDPVRWQYDVGGGGWGNNELQYYTADRLENARVGDGVLTIEARKEAFQGRDYTSARLLTRGRASWQYGRVAVRANLPSGRGTWPAIWMLYDDAPHGNGGWPDNGEIDIMEHVGHVPDTIYGTVHTRRYNHVDGTQRGDEIVVADAEIAFHEYAIEWTPEKIDFFVDDTKYFTFENDGGGWEGWPFAHDFFLILNVAVGGNWGGQQGVDDAIFPQQLQVDYVRVYRYTGHPEVTLQTPAADTTLAEGAPLTLAAEASDPDGSLAYVELLQRDGVVARRTAPPYTFVVPEAAAGCYQVRVRAVDDGGWTTETPARAVDVGAGCPQAPYLIAPHTVPGVVEAEYYDLGGAGTAYLDLNATNTGGALRTDEGVDLAVTSDAAGSYHVTDIAAREWLAYQIDAAQGGTYTVDARVAAGPAGGALRLRIDGEDLTGTIPFGTTGGLNTWDIVRSPAFELPAGRHTLRVDMVQGGFNLNRLTFRLLSGTDTGHHELPEQLRLEPNYPNPFHPDTVIGYAVPEAGWVSLTVYDARGRLVRRLRDGFHTPGRYDAAFDAGGLPSGLYVYRLRSSRGEAARTMTLVK